MRPANMKTLGKIAGGVGLLLVLTSVVSLLFTSGSWVVFGVKLGLGAALLVGWAVTNGDRVSSWTRSVFYYSSSVLIGVAFVGLLGAANFIVAKRGKTWDLTAKKIFSLAPQTTSALEGLAAPVKVIAFSETGPIESVENLLKRYAEQSDRFSYEFKDPRKAPDLTLKYQVRQGQPTAVLVKQGDVESHQVVNLQRLANPQLGEQELTNALLKLQQVGSQKLYFLTGHGEWPLDPPGAGEDAVQGALQVRRVLEDEGYAPEVLNLVERNEIPADASAVVIAGARSPYTDPERKLLETYLEKGGRLLYFAEPGGDPGLKELLARYGFELSPGLVADPRVSPDQPYLVISPFFAEHEVTRLLKNARANVVFATTLAVTVLREGLPEGVSAVPVVLTTPYAWVETTLSENPTLDSGEKAGQLTLAAVATRNTAQVEGKRSDEARVVVFGDADVLGQTFGFDPNRNLVMNAFAWTTTQMEKITIRPVDRDISTIELTPDMLSTIRLLSMDLLPTLLIGIGLAIWLTRRAR